MKALNTDRLSSVTNIFTADVEEHSHFQGSTHQTGTKATGDNSQLSISQEKTQDSYLVDPCARITNSVEKLQLGASMIIQNADSRRAMVGLRTRRQLQPLSIQTDLSTSTSTYVNSLTRACNLNNVGAEIYEKKCAKNSNVNSEDHQQAVSTLLSAWSSFSDVASTQIQRVVTRPSMLSSQVPGAQTSESSSSSLKYPPATSYIYQRSDFDEGMSRYSDAIRLHKQTCFFPTTPSPEFSAPRNWCLRHEAYCKCCCQKDYLATVGATIMFNVGLVYLSQEDSCNAMQSFVSAFDLLSSSQEDEPSDKVHIELGHLRKEISHPLAIPILHKIGQIQYKSGNLNAAVTSFASALKFVSKLDSRIYVMDLAHTCNSLGVLHYHRTSEDSDLAMEYFQKALSLYSSILSSDHPVIATTLNNIGRIYVQRDDFATALDFYENSLQIRKANLGEDSLDYAATAFNAAQSLHQLGDFDQALHLYREFLRVAVKNYTVNHRDVAVVLSGIAQIYQEKGEYDEAETLFEQSIEAGKAALGECHAEVAMMLNRVGNFYFERKDFDAAIRFYSDGLAMEMKIFDVHHPNILVTLSNLGEIHRHRKEWGRAIELYNKVLEIQRSRFGIDKACIEVASTLHTLGLIYDQKGESSSALRFLQDALVMRRTVLGDDHLDVSSTLTSLGTIFYRLNSLKMAMGLFQESLGIRRRVLGVDHRDVAFTLYNIALVHQQQGRYLEAIECFQETLRIEKLRLGDDHRDVAITFYKLGEVYKSNDDYDRALNYFQMALDIDRKSADDPSSIARTLNEIGNIHLIRGDLNKMMESFNEAARFYRLAGLSTDNLIVSRQPFSPNLRLPSCAPAA